MDYKNFLRSNFSELASLLEILDLKDSWEYNYEEKNFILTSNILNLANNSETQDLSISNFFSSFVDHDDTEVIANFIDNLVHQFFVKNILIRGTTTKKSNQLFLVTGTIEFNATNKPIRALGYIANVSNYLSPDHELFKKNTQQEVLANFTKVLLNKPLINEKTFIQDILLKITEVLHVEIADILVKTKESNDYLKMYEKYDQTDHFSFPYNIDINGTAAGKAYKTLTPVLIENLSHDLPIDTYKVLQDYKINSGIFSPITYSRGRWGVLSALSFEKNSFSTSDLSFMQSLANLIGTHRDQQISDQKQMIITNFSALALKLTDEQIFFDRICKDVGKLFDAEFTALSRFDSLSNEFKLVSTFVQNTDFSLKSFKFDPNSVAGFTYFEDSPVILNDKILSEKFQMTEFFKKNNLKSGVSCPIANNRGRYGVFGCFSTHSSQISNLDEIFFQNVINIINSFLERKAISEELIKSRLYETTGRLAGGVAHDFNNYLSIIQGYIDLVQQEILGKNESSMNEIQKFNAVININKAIENSSNLVKRLQSLSRYEVVQYQNININTVITDLKDILMQKIKLEKNKNISIHFDLSTDPIFFIKGDPSQFSQIILNLVVNSIEAIDKNNPQGLLELKTRNTLQTDVKNEYELAHLGIEALDYVHLSVTDNGIGMNDDMIGKIFTPYFSGEKSAPTGQNLGLGLSIVYGIVKQMKGEILVHSEVGKGTKFDLFFPAVEKKMSINQKAKDKNNNTISNIPDKNFTILVVDDNIDFMNFLEILLKRNNYNILTATNGKEGLKEFKKHSDIDIIITDVIMPEMNANEFIQEIRKIKENIPILIISGYTRDIIDPEMLNSITSFLKKPFVIEELVYELKKLISGKKIINKG